MVAAGVAALWVICHSAFGLTLVAVRENSVRAGFIGVDTRRMRWAAFTVAGTFGGLAGALFGMYHRGMYIENAFWTESAQVLIMVLLGGIYSFVGPIIGAAVLHLLQIFTNQYTPYWPTVLGLILLVIVLVLPDGLIGLVARVKARRRHERMSRHAAASRACGSRSPASSPRATSRSSSRPARLHAIIGPNGAGKTTFFNLITGHLRPDKGTVSFEGRDLVGLPPQKIVRLGIARSFQRINIYPRLTVFENVQVALIAHEGQQWNLFRPGRSLHREGTQELLELVGLAAEAAETGGELSYGKQKQLELAIALASQPRLLLLDEPTAGMSPQETGETIASVRDIVKARGLTLLFTEHDMAVVFGIAERISVLHHGEIIASGEPDAVRNDPEVKRVYLGEQGHG